MVLASINHPHGNLTRYFKLTHYPGLGLLDLITGYDRVIIIDAIKTEGGQAGKIYRLSAENLSSTGHLASSHDINLATAFELGKKLRIALPQQITIFAVEVVDVTTFSEKCAPEVEKAIPLAVSMIAEELGGDRACAILV